MSSSGLATVTAPPPLILDCLLFRPDISKVAADGASVLRCTLSGPSPDRSPACTLLQPAPSAWESVRSGSAASAPACTVTAIDVGLNMWYCGHVGYGHRGVSCG